LHAAVNREGWLQYVADFVLYLRDASRTYLIHFELQAAPTGKIPLPKDGIQLTGLDTPKRLAA